MEKRPKTSFIPVRARLLRARFTTLLWLAALGCAANAPYAQANPGSGTDAGSGGRPEAGSVSTHDPDGLSSAPGAHGSSAASDADGLSSALQRWIEASAASTWTVALPHGSPDGNGADLRVEVKVGQLNPRLRLAPCERIEPFLPAGTRLWGRSFIGIRCVAGASWSTMLPVEVSVYGPALVARLPMRAGAMPDRENFRIEQVDWTASTHLPVSDPTLLQGRALGRALAAGQVLHAGDLRVPQTFAAGDPVRVRMIGNGFSISTSGFALAAGGEGQSLRIRTETGKMLVGIVRDRTVEIRL